MRFRFCGDADCPDWVLAEINTLSRLSSIKLKLLGNVVAQGIVNCPIDLDKAKKLFADSKLDVDIDLKACIACLSYIISSTVKFNCDATALFSELQQLGLPREHSTSIKRVVNDNRAAVLDKLKDSSLKINELKEVEVDVDQESQNAAVHLKIDGEETTVFLTPHTVDVLLNNLETLRPNMVELANHSWD